MTWRKIARKDFRDAVQSRALWALVGVFVVLSMVSSFAYIEAPELFGEPAGATFDGLIMFTVGLVGLFVPLAAIVVCYKSLAGERESGSVKLLLSLPTTRRNVVFGKLLGRSAVLLVGLGVGLLIGIAFGSLLLGEFGVRSVAGLVAVTTVFIIVYASIVVGISAVTGSTARATTLALGFFVVAELVWDVVPMAILYVTGGFSMPTEIPDWGFAMMQLSPSTAYLSAVIAAIPGPNDEAIADTGVGVEAGTPDAFVASPEFGVVVLVAWLIVPLFVGLSRFDRADL